MFLFWFDKTEEYLEEQNIKVLIYKTAEAVKEFNRQLGESGIVGAFHLTC